jgi:hypothetical protein
MRPARRSRALSLLFRTSEDPNAAVQSVAIASGGPAEHSG